jgi:hypothetical protein
LVADGKAKTREECEEWAIRHAEEHAEENAMIIISDGVKVPSFTTYEESDTSDFELDHRWNWDLLGKWRFVLWPPQAQSRSISTRSELSGADIGEPTNNAPRIHQG